MAPYEMPGELVGTAYVARDLLMLINALGEDGLLRYWGEILFLAWQW